MAWLGFVVKERSAEHPKGFQVSGRMQTLRGAQDMKEFLEKTALREGKKAEFFVVELTTREA